MISELMEIGSPTIVGFYCLTLLLFLWYSSISICQQRNAINFAKYYEKQLLIVVLVLSFGLGTYLEHYSDKVTELPYTDVCSNRFWSFQNFELEHIVPMILALPSRLFMKDDDEMKEHVFNEKYSDGFPVSKDMVKSIYYELKSKAFSSSHEKQLSSMQRNIDVSRALCLGNVLIFELVFVVICISCFQ